MSKEPGRHSFKRWHPLLGEWVIFAPTTAGLNENEIESLADIYREVLIRYDNVFMMPFPNITIFRNAPCAKDCNPEPYHFHIEFCPPLRSRDKLKYMAGFETGGGNIINPSLPRESAETLRSVSTVHYRNKDNINHR